MTGVDRAKWAAIAELVIVLRARAIELDADAGRTGRQVYPLAESFRRWADHLDDGLRDLGEGGPPEDGAA